MSLADKKKLRGAEGFEQYYANLFGIRWPDLRSALCTEPVYAEWKACEKKSYFLDTASVLAAVTLPVKGAQRILDLCAAPGGKTLVLAGRMDSDASLISNDRSPARKQRLVHVCDECLPDSVRSRVTVTCSDGALWCTRQSECFDRILLDAPCSSERHVLTDPGYLAKWSPARIKTLSMEQWALLSSAYRLLAPDGYLLYATCALVPEENDRVVARLFKKFESAETGFECGNVAIPDGAVAYCSVRLPGAERTEFGWHVLPDRQHGAGPLYFALVHKKKSDVFK